MLQAVVAYQKREFGMGGYQGAGGGGTVGADGHRRAGLAVEHQWLVAGLVSAAVVV